MTDLQVGRIGRPHGVRGEVTVAPMTDDDVAVRFAVGSVFATQPPAAGPLTVARIRHSGQILLLAFEGVDDRNSAETLRGTSLLVDSDSLPDPTDEDEFYDHQLVGLAVFHLDGTELGTVTGVLHPPAAPVLEVRTGAGDEELVPFVSAIVPEVDLVAGRLTVDPPEGMFTPATD